MNRDNEYKSKTSAKSCSVIRGSTLSINNNKVNNITEQQYEEDWLSDIKPESVEKAVNAGEILPRLELPQIREGKVNSDETLLVKFVENPKPVPGQSFMTAVVEHQGAKKSMICPKSLRFSLKKEIDLKKVGSLVGNTFIIGSHKQDTKFGKNQTLYWAQWHEQSEKKDEE